jgi:ParB family chromosome partitioning protein
VVGKSRSHVANLLRLLDLPDAIKKLVDDGKLSMGHARALLSAKDAETVARQIIAEGLNVRQTEALINGTPAPQPAAKPQSTAPKAPHAPRAPGEEMKSEEVVEIESMLAENLGLRVSLNTRGAQAGDVVISYDTLAQLDEILRRLGGTMY